MQDAAAPRRDIYRLLTDQLIAAMEATPGTFVLPWRQGGTMQLPVNALSQNPYSGVNVLSLWLAARQRDFVQPIWATYKQWAQLGAQVRGGEKASPVVFYKQYEREPDPDDAEDNGQRRVARASFVFNAEQVAGYHLPAPPPRPGPIERLSRADALVAATGATISYGGDRAFYAPSRDYITLPDQDRFIGSATMDRREAYYATLLHELCHWTGAKHRLDRDLSGRFGTQAYAAEELVAEIGAAFLCADLQITSTLRADHAQYLAHWVRLLKSDSRAIFAAAARASDAARYLHRLGEPAAPRATGDAPVCEPMATTL